MLKNPVENSHFSTAFEQSCAKFLVENCGKRVRYRVGGEISENSLWKTHFNRLSPLKVGKKIIEHQLKDFFSPIMVDWYSESVCICFSTFWME